MDSAITYACPRCGGVARRTGAKAGWLRVLAACILGDVYGPLRCGRCGQLAHIEFSLAQQRRITGCSLLRRLLLVTGFAAVAWLLLLKIE